MHGILSFGTWLNMFFFGLYIIYLPVLQKINSCTLRSSKTIVYSLKRTERFLLIKMGNYCK